MSPISLQTIREKKITARFIEPASAIPANTLVFTLKTPAPSVSAKKKRRSDERANRVHVFSNFRDVTQNDIIKLYRNSELECVGASREAYTPPHRPPVVIEERHELKLQPLDASQEITAVTQGVVTLASRPSELRNFLPGDVVAWIPEKYTSLITPAHESVKLVPFKENEVFSFVPYQNIIGTCLETFESNNCMVVNLQMKHLPVRFVALERMSMSAWKLKYYSVSGTDGGSIGYAISENWVSSLTNNALRSLAVRVAEVLKSIDSVRDHMTGAYHEWTRARVCQWLFEKDPVDVYEGDDTDASELNPRHDRYYKSAPDCHFYQAVLEFNNTKLSPDTLLDEASSASVDAVSMSHEVPHWARDDHIPADREGDKIVIELDPKNQKFPSDTHIENFLKSVRYTGQL